MCVRSVIPLTYLQLCVCWLDITFFGEKLPDAFDNALKADRGVVDLVVVMGSSLKVQVPSVFPLSQYRCVVTV